MEVCVKIAVSGFIEEKRKSQEWIHGFPKATKSRNAKMAPVPRSYIGLTGICHKKEVSAGPGRKSLGRALLHPPLCPPKGIGSALTVHLQEVGLQVWVEASSGQAVTQVPVQGQDIQ